MRNSSLVADVEQWLRLPTASISDAMGRLGAMDGGIRRLSGAGVAGLAYPVWTGAGDNSTIHRALSSAPARSVLVIDAEGHHGRAVWGFILTVAARHRQLAGVVVDGAVRDIDEIRSTGFPVYARGVCPAGPHKGFEGRFGNAAQCGGVAVTSGDVVVGDADGVVVVPSARANAVYRDTKKRVADEADWIQRIEAGQSTLDVLGLR